MRYLTITLCGSSSFIETINEVNEKLSLSGHVVLSLAPVQKRLITDEQQSLLMAVHFKKIMMSDCVIVIDQHNDEPKYIGEMVSREIEWAELNNIPVHYISEIESITNFKL